MAIAPSGFYLYRTTNSSWQGANGNSTESYGSGPLQHYVDFDLLGPRFRVSFTGGLGATGLAQGIDWNIRIGGNWAPSQLPGFLPITGDLVVLGNTGPIGVFGTGSVTTIVDNLWSGTQLVQLTGSVAGAGAFALGPTLIFLPVEAGEV